MPRIAHFAVVVRDYDEAIDFYVTKLGFELVEDQDLPAENKRWVTVRPPRSGADATTVLLARASNDHQRKFIGDQTGGRVSFFLSTDDFQRDFDDYTAKGIEWVRAPSTMSYGRVAVFRDLYGNLWDLIEHSQPR